MTVNEKDYTVLKLLGKGKGGYSYLVTDGEKNYVLKQLHHEPCDYYQFGDKLESELKDYDTLRRLGLRMPRLLAADREQERLLKEYVEGDTIADLGEKSRIKAEHLAQMEQMCALLYPAGLNIDYYPTNFVVKDEKLWYIDYECNAYDPKWNFENWGRQYWQNAAEKGEKEG